MNPTFLEQFCSLSGFPGSQWKCLPVRRPYVVACSNWSIRPHYSVCLMQLEFSRVEPICYILANTGVRILCRMTQNRTEKNRAKGVGTEIFQVFNTSLRVRFVKYFFDCSNHTVLSLYVCVCVCLRCVCVCVCVCVYV
jgi:hypothetical protein